MKTSFRPQCSAFPQEGGSPGATPEQQAIRNADYIEKASGAFEEIMGGNIKHMLEVFSRANKGEQFVLHYLTLGHTEALPSELSAAMGSSTARISALLGVLEKKGQIAREIDKSNRRNILVTITDTGRARVEQETERMKNTLAGVFSEMGETDTVEFIRLYKKFFEISRKHMPGCGPS